MEPSRPEPYGRLDLSHGIRAARGGEDGAYARRSPSPIAARYADCTCCPPFHLEKRPPRGKVLLIYATPRFHTCGGRFQALKRPRLTP